ncbi:hypothetical protein ALP96_103336 [Pseudomonas savastanoi pv. glycinea]|nr:hypothetical protein AC519_5074 [Pseudomonas savastanoi]KPC58243.1 Unknown protein sequence [Pseudomonas amygdali pv. morsprunorum]RMM99801.1 hypothetical protein ALQ69_104132 [Pseudomonas savastanoi pv. glycinea]RMP50171.1 hypothetical protein ALQ21_103125 [Pseudomonas savastanoi pv. glycinea]RMQ87017.1 hypothetical protein ALP96_103336 [Pseudomonas savastanoi pv. glycinea]
MHYRLLETNRIHSLGAGKLYGLSEHRLLSGDLACMQQA